MAFDVVGKLHRIGELREITSRLSKLEFVVEIEDGKYPQLVSFEATNNRAEQLDGLSVGDEVRVTFNLRGREWTSPKGETKYFNSLDAWKVEKVGATSERRGDEQQRSRGGAHEPAPADPFAGRYDDDIPFATCSMDAEPSPEAPLFRRMPR